ncbi:MAG: hypothetical protein KKC99_00280 [Proteobacteria bacterium]|nr:hypothetical protein [Pseudomonadota bacterium]
MGGMDGIGGSGMDSKTFGAAVVSETLDTMNSGSDSGSNSYDFQKQVLGAHAGLGSSAAGLGAGQPTDKETFGASVVSSTLDAMNTDAMGNSDSSYEFQKKVLSAFTGNGSIVNAKG